MTRRGRVAVANLVIENEADHKRALATTERLMCRDQTLQEDALLRVLSNEIERFESVAYPEPSAESTPAELIQFLLEQNGDEKRADGDGFEEIVDREVPDRHG